MSGRTKKGDKRKTKNLLAHARAAPKSEHVRDVPVYAIPIERSFTVTFFRGYSFDSFLRVFLPSLVLFLLSRPAAARSTEYILIIRARPPVIYVASRARGSSEGILYAGGKVSRKFTPARMRPMKFPESPVESRAVAAKLRAPRAHYVC